MEHGIIEFKKLSPSARTPTRGTPNSAGFDLCALATTIIDHEDGVIAVPTGIAVKLPHGVYGRIAARSGLAKNYGLCVTAGVIDRDYRGEICVLIHTANPGITGATALVIKAGERFAQLVPEAYWDGVAAEVTEFYDPDMKIPHAGFGSTGKF